MEPDEDLAVQRFLKAANADSNLGKLKTHPDALSLAWDIYDRSMAARLQGQPLLSYTVEKGAGGNGWSVVDDHLSPDQWQYLRRTLIDHPKWVAQKVGLEQVGWLPDLKRPTESPKLTDLMEVYAGKPGITSEEIARCRRFWKEFVEIVGIQTLRELEHEHVEKYEAAITDKDLAAKSIKHRYTRVRTVIAYAMRRGKGQEDCRRALDKLAMLEVEDVNTLNPNPIKPADFWKVHAAAGKAGDTAFAALMLFALNAALYPSEVGAVRWEDVDLGRAEFSTRRNKTKVPRVATLWPETIDALKAMPRDRATIFNTKVQQYSRMSIHRDWTVHRTEAKVKDGITFGMIRDAAFTIGCQESLDQARVLAGHRLPGAVDHYVLRNAQFVKRACDAIRAAFELGKHVTCRKN